MRHFLTLFLLAFVSGYSVLCAQPPIKAPEYGVVKPSDFDPQVVAGDTAAAGIILYSGGYFTIEGGSLIIKVHRRIKILKESAFDDLGTIQTDYSKGIYEGIGSFKGYVAFLDNSGLVQKVEAIRDDVIREKKSEYSRQFKYTFPKLKENCVIEYTYNIVYDGFRLALNQVPDWEIQERYPVAVSEFCGFTEYYLEANVSPIGTMIPLDKYVNENRSTGSIKYHLIASDIKAFKEEPYVTNCDQYKFRLQFLFDDTYNPINPFSSWEGFSKYFYINLKNNLLTNRDIKDTVNILVQGLSTDKEKFKVLFDKVSQNIIWENNFTIFNLKKVPNFKNVLIQKHLPGSYKNYLLAYILEEAGIKVTLIAIRLRIDGFLDPNNQRNEYLRHIILNVELDGKTYYADATEPNHPRLELPDYSNVYMGLPIVKINPPTKPILINSTSKIQETVFIKGVLDVEQSRFKGQLSLRLLSLSNAKFRNAGEDLDSVKALILNHFFEGDTSMHLKDIKVTGLEDVDAPLLISATIDMPVSVNEIEGEYYWNPILIYHMNKNPFTSNERTMPIEFQAIEKRQYTLLVELPKEYEVLEAPEAKSFKLRNENICEFKRISSASSENIMFQFDLNYNWRVIPVDYYMDVKSFFDIIVQYQSEQLVIRKKS